MLIVFAVHTLFQMIIHVIVEVKTMILIVTVSGSCIYYYFGPFHVGQ